MADSTDMTTTAEVRSGDVLWDALCLTLVPGLGPRTYRKLIAAFGTDDQILNAPVDALQQVSGVGPKLAAAIKTHGHRREAEAEWQRVQQAGCHLLAISDSAYPTGLREIPDPPPLLFLKGELRPSDALAVAIVGSRHCTNYGLQTAERLAGALARAGVTVVSGLARGIDAAAHRGALSAGGRTFAVCATGLGTVYPPEHRELAEEVAGSGALITESPMLQAPVAGLFPQRNRIISGLSLAVILVEASRKSGALHTARHAVEQNREVFAVPGRIDSDASAGCLDLIRDGATLVRDVDDVLKSLGPLSRPVPRQTRNQTVEVVHHPVELQLSDQERTVLNLLAMEPRAIDEVVRESGLETSRVLTTLTVLEMRGLLTRHPGGQVSRR